ncbi:unnamed protein product [Dracunculus medinensis]|uniref:Cadherin domain-containing protein n=1 Tax=Dracunculus medinensis TaxID=318479 RepID=A0A3P7SXE1_DRAME|nr:unnamed protein product [Dracunculus medinensis]
MQFIAIEEISGEISVKSELDFESRQSYDIIAVPIDGSNAVHVYIRVLDENDNSPTFAVPSINIEISEYTRLNSEISLPLASDPDSPPYSIQKFRIVSGNVNNAFRLSTKEVNSLLYVDLIVNGLLDREYREYYSLVIEAIDGGTPPRKGTLNVSIKILDANDNAPEFTQARYSASIPWNVTKNELVTTVHAVDNDAGDNAKITYSIVRNRPDLVPLFTIDADSGVIRVAEPNFEQGLVYEILILASDHGVPQPLESTAFLSVLVEKSNEKKPHLDFIWLTDSGNPEVYENISLGYVLARILVEQENHESELTISGSSTVCIRQTDSHNIYLLIICGQLDREYKSFYDLLFTLTNHDGIILEHPMRFKVLDVNDNPPRFEQSVLHITINQSSDQFDVLQITAKDIDSGENARITYSLMDMPVLSIEAETGILHIESELNCSSDLVKFRVIAKDNGVPPLSSFVDVIADIVDSNSRPPVFSKPLYEVSIKEDTEQGTCLLKV